MIDCSSRLIAIFRTNSHEVTCFFLDQKILFQSCNFSREFYSKLIFYHNPNALLNNRRGLQTSDNREERN